MKQKRGFTLIELIVVIAILGIIVLLAAPKLLGYNEKAISSAVKADLKTVQTAVDVKIVDNGGISPYNIEIGDAKILDIDTLKPQYIKSLTDREGYEFWIDGWDNVYYNRINPPTNVSYSNGTLSWGEVEDAEEYKVYILSNKKEVSLLEKIGVQTVFADSINLKKQLYATTKDLSITLSKGTYLVSAVKGKEESVAVGESFKGGGTIEGIEEDSKEPTKEIPEELVNIESNGNSLIKVDSNKIEGVQDKETVANDNLTKAIELSKDGDGLFINSGNYKVESNDLFWYSPEIMYSNMIVRKSLTLIGENAESTILTIDDSNSEHKSDGFPVAVSFNAPDITLKNMTIHVNQENIQSLWAVFNVWGIWDNSTSRNLTLENITVIIDSPVPYLFYMNDHNMTVKNMKVISNGNLSQMFYFNYGDGTKFIDSSFDFPKTEIAGVEYINTTFK